MAFSKLSGKSINLSSFVLTSFASTGIDDNATSTAITISPSENVGIGETSPDTKLHVKGDGSSASTIKLERTGSLPREGRVGPNYIGTFSDEDFILYTNSTEKTRIDAAGNVGIGTDDPQAKLDVRANTNSTIRIANDGDGIATLYLRNTGTSDGSITQEAGDMFFQIAGDKKIELRNDGNFGIGRLNPDAKLTVDTDQQLIARLASSNVGITGVRLEGIDTSATDNVYVDWFYDAENRQYGFGEGTSSGSLPINSGINHADVVIKDGNVRIPSGVGLSALSVITNPLTLGSLTGFNLAFDSNEIQARNNGSQNNLILNKNGGTVGIGTTATTYKLEVQDSGDNGIRFASTSSHASLFLDSAAGAGQYIRFSENGTAKWWINSNESDDLNFRANAESGGLLRLQGDDNKVYIENDKDSTADSNYYFTNINYTPTGSDTTSGDRTHVGLFVNTDSSATGGDTANEHRLYGVYSDCRTTADSDLLYAIYGYSRADHNSGQISAQIGVYGIALAHSNAGGTHSAVTGVQGVAASYAVEGVPTLRGGYFLGQATATGDGNITSLEGVRVETQVDSGYTGTITTGYTVRAMHDNNNGSTHTQNTHYLFHGDYTGTLPTTARGLWIADNVPSRFTGNLEVLGTLTKTSGSFKISHPLPELNETHDLVHSFVESPQPDNIYSGMVALVNGSAAINIDTAAGMTEGTFVLLNKNIRRTITNEEGFTAVKSSISGNILTITAQDNTCTDEVFWMVIGQRQDTEIKALDSTDSEGNLIVEPEKGPEWIKEEAIEPETTFDLENPIPE